MNKHILLAIVLVSAVFMLFREGSSEVEEEFQAWKTKFAVTFETSADQFYRKNIFEANLQKIKEHNADPSNTYKMAVNLFTIYTDQEFKERYLDSRLGKGAIYSEVFEEKNEVKSVIIDWSQKGAVGPVKNQGAMGSVVPLVALDSIQSLSKVATGTFTIFSSQQLTDCISSSQRNLISQIYNYYIKNGVCTEQEYPSSPQPQKCREIPGKFKPSGYKSIKDCSSLKDSIMKQPIAVTVDATNWSRYSSGIFSSCGTNLNHMVLLTAMADEYWKAKNSWGTSWGEKGFIRLAPGNTCGICISASYPTQ